MLVGHYVSPRRSPLNFVLGIFFLRAKETSEGIRDFHTSFYIYTSSSSESHVCTAKYYMSFDDGWKYKEENGRGCTETRPSKTNSGGAFHGYKYNWTVSLQTGGRAE